MTPVERAQAAHAATLKRVCGKPAVYARGSSSVSVVAVPARTDAEVVNEQNLATRVTFDDWLIDVADLVLDGQPVEPRARDAVTVDGATYTVLDLGTEGAWRHTNQARATFRVHSRLSS